MLDSMMLDTMTLDTMMLDTMMLDTMMLDTMMLDTMMLDSMMLDSMTLDSMTLDTMMLDSIMLDTMMLDTMMLDSMMLDTMSLDTMMLDTMMLDTMMLDTMMLDTMMLDSMMLDSMMLDTMMLDTMMLDTMMLDTMMLDTMLLDTMMLDTMMLDTMMLDTMLLDTMMLDTMLLDTMMLDTMMLDSIVTLEGKISTDIGRAIPSVDLLLTANFADTSFTESTDTFGVYAFEDVSAMNNYTLTADKDDLPITGVTTLDMIMVQRHILKLDTLDTPYKVIAADVSTNQAVSIVDIIVMRRMVLGVIDEWNNGGVWHFVDKSSSFADPVLPWPFTDSLQLIDSTENYSERDLIGIKIGDVNNSFETETGLAAEVRAQTDQVIEYSERKIADGYYAYNFILKSEEPVYGFQFDVKDLEESFLSIQPVQLNIDGSNYYLNDNQFKMSWHDPHGTMLTEDPLFTIYTEKEITVDQLRSISNEIYMGDDISTSDLTFSKIEKPQPESFTLLQNVPNPYLYQTTLSFILPDDGEAQITVFDSTGKRIYQQKSFYRAGLNELILSDLDSRGVLHYQLDYQGDMQTGKMISIR